MTTCLIAGLKGWLKVQWFDGLFAIAGLKALPDDEKAGAVVSV